MELHSLPGFATLFEIEPNLRADAFSPFFLTLTEDELRELSVTFKEIEQLNKVDTVENNVKLIAKILYLIPVFCRSILNNHTKIIENRHNYNHADATAIIKTMEYINEHYYEKILIDDLAKQANMSRSSYLRSFKQLTKQSPIEYVTHIRIEHAASMLLSDASITRVAQDCGFYDSSHFTRCFMKLKNTTPLAYKKANS